MNKTIYIREADAAVWDEAARMLPFYRRMSLSQFLTEKVKEYVHEETSGQRHQAKAIGAE